jgi:dimethylargininase
MNPTALIRAVPKSFANALVMGDRPSIDVGRAREQHRLYKSFLEETGYTVVTVDTDENHPDCPFIEDAAVVLDTLAVITRSGAPERRGETGPVEAALQRMLSIRHIQAPGTIDGGDVLRMGSTIYIGLSTRTNEEAIRQFAGFAAEDGLSVVAVPVSGVLHLKSAVVALDDESVLIAPDCVDPEYFAAYRRIEKASGEEHLASVLRLRGGVLGMTTTAPETTGRLRAAGFDPQLVDSSEFQAADGGLTCLSILIESVEARRLR